MQENTTTQTGYVLKYKDGDTEKFLGFVLKNLMNAEDSSPEFEPQAGESAEIGSIVLSDLQGKDVAVYAEKEKAETSKSVLMNQQGADQSYAISVVEIQTDPNTQERSIVAEM